MNPQPELTAEQLRVLRFVAGRKFKENGYPRDPVTNADSPTVFALRDMGLVKRDAPGFGFDVATDAGRHLLAAIDQQGDGSQPSDRTETDQQRDPASVKCECGCEMLKWNASIVYRDAPNVTEWRCVKCGTTKPLSYEGATKQADRTETTGEAAIAELRERIAQREKVIWAMLKSNGGRIVTRDRDMQSFTGEDSFRSYRDEARMCTVFEIVAPVPPLTPEPGEAKPALGTAIGSVCMYIAGVPFDHSGNPIASPQQPASPQSEQSAEEKSSEPPTFKVGDSVFESLTGESGKVISVGPGDAIEVRLDRFSSFSRYETVGYFGKATVQAASESSPSPEGKAFAERVVHTHQFEGVSNVRLSSVDGSVFIDCSKGTLVHRLTEDKVERARKIIALHYDAATAGLRESGKITEQNCVYHAGLADVLQRALYRKQDQFESAAAERDKLAASLTESEKQAEAATQGLEVVSAERDRLASQLKAAESREQWVSSDKQSPPDNELVLTWRGNAWPPHYKLGTDGQGGGTPREYVVTHWMRLPNPPAAESALAPKGGDTK